MKWVIVIGYYVIGKNVLLLVRNILKVQFLFHQKKVNNFLKNVLVTTTNQFRPFGAFKLGFCLWMLNKREGIKEIYQQIPTWVRPNVAYDRYAQVHSANFLKNGCFTPFEEKFFPLMNLIESKDFNGAKTKLEELKDFFLTYNSGYETFQDLQAKLLFVEGKILHALHCNLEAKQILEVFSKKII